MGWFVFLFLLPTLPQDSVPDRKSLFEALDNPTETGLEKNLRECLSHDAGVVKTLYSAWIRCEKSLREHRDQEKHWNRMMVKYDDTVRGNKDSNTFEFLKARQSRNETRRKIGLLELYQGRILRGFPAAQKKKEDRDLVRLLREGPPIIRAWCALALGGGAEREIPRKALLGAVRRERTPLVLVALMDALAEDPKAVPFLVKALKHGHWQVQSSAAGALAKTKERASASALIDALPTVSGRIAHEFNEALKSITGVDKHGNAPLWKEWWDENHEAFLAGTYRPSMGERAQDRGKSTFYGVRVRSRRVLFLLDVSPSMKQSTTWLPDDPAAREELRGDRLVDVAGYELRQLLRTLPDDATFNVMLFWKDRELALKKPGRGRKALKAAMNFVEEIPLRDGTDHWAALCRGYRTYGDATPKANLSRLDFDTIFLISDGLPSTGIRDADILVERLGDMNRFRKIAVHTVALESDGRGNGFLERVARATGGRFIRR